MSPLLVLFSIFLTAHSFAPIHSTLSSYYILLARSRAEKVRTSAAGTGNSRPFNGTTTEQIIASTTIPLPLSGSTGIGTAPLLHVAPFSELAPLVERSEIVMDITQKTQQLRGGLGDSTSTSTSTSATTATKVIYGVRHARSIANDYLLQPGNRWGDPTFRDDWCIRDARLSETGLGQVDKLSKRLLDELGSPPNSNSNDRGGGCDGFDSSSSNFINHDHWLNQVELVVVSPLTRCLQTWELGCRPALVCALEASKNKHRQSTSSSSSSLTPSLSSISSLSSTARDDPANSESSSTTTATTSSKSLPLKVVVLPLATERVYTAGETGRPVQELQEEFTSNTDTLVTDWSAFEELAAETTNDGDHRWWYHESSDSRVEKKYDEWRPHGEGQYYAVPGEPLEIFATRMTRLKEWLQLRPEKNILLVTHWGVLNHLTGQDMKNCGIVRMEL